MKLKHCFSIVLFLLFFSVYEKANAQAPDCLWAKTVGGTGDDYGLSIAVDVSGNVYTTGYFEGTVDFDPGAATFNLTSKGSNDIFISKLDSSGNFIWAKAIGGTGDDRAYSLAIDNYGNVYTTGYFNGTVDFDPDSNIFNLTTNGFADVFISKTDSQGNFVWAKSMGGFGQIYSYSIAIDDSGSVYTTGNFGGTIDFDPGTGIFNLTTGYGDMFISKLDSAGNFVWAKQIGGTSEVFGLSIAVDASCNVYTTGYFKQTADFDPGTGTFNLTTSGAREIFISKFDSSGNFIWAKAMDGINSNEGHAIAIDPEGNVYTTGAFLGPADFDPGAGIYNLISSAGYDTFISKLDSLGNFVWAKSMVATLSGDGKAIAVDASGNVYTTGLFAGTTDFDPGPGAFNLTAAGSFDIFISRLDSSGNFTWAKQMTGTDDQQSLSIALGPSGNAYVTGWFQSPYITVSPITLTNIDSTGVTRDIFIAKLDNTISGIQNMQLNNNVSLYPNPATNHLTIVLAGSSKKVLLTITDITGKIIYTTTAIATQKIEMNTKDFAQGVYTVQIQTGEFIETKKLIIVK